MGLKVFFDFSKGRNGVIVLGLMDGEKQLDQETISFRHPFLLRLRMLLGVSRMKRRQVKIGKFVEKINKDAVK